MSKQDSTGIRVVVVGGTGNVGTSVVAALADDPGIDEVTALARRNPPWTPAAVPSASCDIVTDDLVEHFRGADVVVHLAWIFQPTRDPVATWRNNVLGSIRVFEAVADAGVPALIYASSVGAYSPGRKDELVDEDWPTHGWPGAAYTREKSYLERYLDAFERDHQQTRVVRLRPGFTFKEGSAAEQRRLFIGPFLPARLARPELLPAIPDLPRLRFQVVHTSDVAEAYRLAVRTSVRGAFNIAADPVVDPSMLARLFRTRTLRVPDTPARAALSFAWHAHLVPASPHLFDAVLRLPLMDTSRARTDLGWSPTHSSAEAIIDFVHGLRRSRGMATPPLEPELPGGRLQEIRTGMGQRE